MANILIAVEDKAYGESLVRFLSKWELPAETAFYVMVVIKPLVLHDFGYPMSRGFFDPLLEVDNGYAIKLLDHVEACLKKEFPAASTTKIIEYGAVVQKILKESAEKKIDWILLGSHGRTGVNKFLLGSVSQAVANRANCTVTVVREREVDDHSGSDCQPVDTAIGTKVAGAISPYKILVPIKDAKFSVAQMDFVCKLSKTDNTQVRLLNTTSSSTEFNLSHVLPPSFFEEFGNELDRISDSLLSDSAEQLKEKFPKMKIEKLRLFGAPKTDILSQVSEENIDLVVIGSHSQSGKDKFFLGSVAQSVVNHAQCSVTIVRLPEDPAKLEEEKTPNYANLESKSRVASASRSSSRVRASSP